MLDAYHTAHTVIAVLIDKFLLQFFEFFLFFVTTSPIPHHRYV
jgi:hypothetical protein